MADPKTFQFNLPGGGRPEGVSPNEMWYPGIVPYALAASSARSVDPITGIRAIVIHATAGGSSEGAVSVIKSAKASFHWLIPDENEAAHGSNVWATCHEARRAWHVRNTASHDDVYFGENRINDYSLGIEIVNKATGKDAYSDWQVAATAQLVRYCWEKYPNLKYIVSHAKLDPARRTDPAANFPWDVFRELVLQGSQPVAEIKAKSQATKGIARNARDIPEQIVFPG